jgi:putative spermidine/putrescine transport system ATP-binding protein
MALADLMVVMEDGHIRQAGPPREVFERPVSAFVARFIGGHNILQGPDGTIAVRADRCRLGIAGDGPHVSGRVAAVEYQGISVRVAVSVGGAEDASVLVPDDAFYAEPVQPGDAATLIWAERDAHALEEVG